MNGFVTVSVMSRRNNCGPAFVVVKGAFVVGIVSFAAMDAGRSDMLYTVPDEFVQSSSSVAEADRVFTRLVVSSHPDSIVSRHNFK